MAKNKKEAGEIMPWMEQTYYLAEQTRRLMRFMDWKVEGQNLTLDSIIRVCIDDVKTSLEKVKKLKPEVYKALLATEQGDMFRSIAAGKIVTKKPAKKSKALNKAPRAVPVGGNSGRI